MKKDLEKIKQALDDHLSGINENTAEIQALFDYIHDLEVKLEKMAQRLDNMQLSQDKEIKPGIITLNQKERKVFLVFYTEEIPLSYHEVGEKAGLSVALIPECISSLTNKGIPFIRSFSNDQIFLKLEPQFKELQAKENVVNLSLQSFME